ncbi:hypothetical protein KUTeg_010614 [Tegillarca granosa]|uniref:Homeobox domain-containing protein n=1 Tax=Tegillarca granosa TaxID=220873 RepID=A0ABQ9F347_TEGGR|nr:hypothetical protein KUTeg_010614 [Tegillarca granosa]
MSVIQPVLTSTGFPEVAMIGTVVTAVPTTQAQDSTLKTETTELQNEEEKRSIYGHPLFPLMALLFEKCEMATQTPDCPSSDSFDVDIQAFVQHQEKDNKPFFSDDSDLDALMVKAIQVLRIHLLELEKVNELCKDFCTRYIACLKGKLQSEQLLRIDSDFDDIPFEEGSPTSSNQMQIPQVVNPNVMNSANSLMFQQGITPPGVSMATINQGQIVSGGTVYQMVQTPQGLVAQPIQVSLYCPSFPVWSELYPGLVRSFVRTLSLSGQNTDPVLSDPCPGLVRSFVRTLSLSGQNTDPVLSDPCPGLVRSFVRTLTLSCQIPALVLSDPLSEHCPCLVKTLTLSCQIPVPVLSEPCPVLSELCLCPIQSTPLQTQIGTSSVIHGSTPLSQIGVVNSQVPQTPTTPTITTQVPNTPLGLNSGSDDEDISGKKKNKRGVLPKPATQVMKSWLFQHIVHPYPTEDEKRQIAAQTNLTLLQVNNWFINARRRILQPMLDASNPEQIKAKKSKPQNRPLQRFWPESIANIQPQIPGVTMVTKSETEGETTSTQNSPHTSDQILGSEERVVDADSSQRSAGSGNHGDNLGESDFSDKDKNLTLNSDDGDIMYIDKGNDSDESSSE